MVFEAPGPSNVHVWLSGCRVKPPGEGGPAEGDQPPMLLGAQGLLEVSYDSPRAQACTFEFPTLQNVTKIQREEPQERKKERKLWWDSEKKSENFWAVPARGRYQGKRKQRKKEKKNKEDRKRKKQVNIVIIILNKFVIITIIIIFIFGSEGQLRPARVKVNSTSANFDFGHWPKSSVLVGAGSLSTWRAP